MDPELPAEYWHTTYFADTPVGNVRLRIGLEDWPTEVMLTRENADSWAFITAWNPGGRENSAGDNEARNVRLSARLANWHAYPGRGVGDFGTHFEESFFVLGISHADAVGLGKEFGQNAILFGRRGETPELVDCR